MTIRRQPARNQMSEKGGIKAQDHPKDTAVKYKWDTSDIVEKILDNMCCERRRQSKELSRLSQS